jgi:RND superfamily putative drug exporter
VYDQLKNNFSDGGQTNITLAVHANAAAELPATQKTLGTYLDKLKQLDGVDGARVVGVTDNYYYVQLGEAYPSQSERAQQAVRDVRSTAAPAGWQVESGGQTAMLTDLLDSLRSKLPLAGAIIVLATSFLMFLMLGSVVMPIKAIILNVLSLSAAFGLLAWVFQDGNLVSQLGLVSNGTLDATQPVLIFAIAFGLAMDYELFLLSRIKEEYDRTGNNTNAVAIGVEQTAGIITSAALMLVVVIGLFATGKVTVIEQVGIGLGAAVAIDATLVRMVLVPSAMQLLGRANWWAPRPLARLARRMGLKEGA